MKKVYQVEFNDWHDNFWGSCVCNRCTEEIHHNNLGQLLVIIRDRKTR